ncbi:hypothetical protein [Modestobacter sp. KNN46-3]|jgi:ABC-2 type transport system permease protein|uniref:hypothetical protein n=1 Tax=Modestobacter sp. KNN46-3 TaxID=2711218 RepID=UPI0013E0C750|nr:hypothetical protein [Modestobacter sp. KNN46-3]
MTTSSNTMTLDTAAPARPAVRPTRASLPTLVGLEVRKTLTTRSGRMLALAAGLAGPAGMGLLEASDDAFPSVAGPFAVAGIMTGLLLLAMGVLSTAGEWTHRTAQTTYLLVPQRGRVLAAKTVATALLGAALTAVSMGASWLILAVLADPGVSWDGAAQAALTAVGAGAAFALIGVGVGAATANTPAALTGLYLTILGLVQIIRAWDAQIADAVDPQQAVLRFARGDAEVASLLTLGGWVVAALVAGWVFSRRRPVQ